MLYIIGILLFGSIIFTGIDEAIYEYKRGKLFKKEKHVLMGRAAYDSGTLGEEVQSFGCGSYFIIFLVVAIIIIGLIYLG